MKLILAFLLWCLLLIAAWPVAVLALAALPLLWLISIPLRILWWCVTALLAAIKAVLFLPARLLGSKSAS